MFSVGIEFVGCGESHLFAVCINSIFKLIRSVSDVRCEWQPLYKWFKLIWLVCVDHHHHRVYQREAHNEFEYIELGKSNFQYRSKYIIETLTICVGMSHPSMSLKLFVVAREFYIFFFRFFVFCRTKEMAPKKLYNIWQKSRAYHKK